MIQNVLESNTPVEHLIDKKLSKNSGSNFNKRDINTKQPREQIKKTSSNPHKEVKVDKEKGYREEIYKIQEELLPIKKQMDNLINNQNFDLKPNKKEEKKNPEPIQVVGNSRVGIAIPQDRPPKTKIDKNSIPEVKTKPNVKLFQNKDKPKSIEHKYRPYNLEKTIVVLETSLRTKNKKSPVRQKMLSIYQVGKSTMEIIHLR